MGFVSRLLRIPTPEQVAPIVATNVVANLDRYHNEWASFNREIEGRVVKLEGLDEAVRLLELRTQELEQSRHKLRADCEELLEQVTRLMNRLRMRQQREDVSSEASEQELLLLRKGGYR